MSKSPCSILKRSSNTSNTTRRGVHFPPTECLTSVYSTHSPSAYDRSPIAVTPNACRLPERGCPGRTYVLDESAIPVSARRKPICSSRVLHPRAMTSGMDQKTHLDSLSETVPPLIPDLSSESDESDSFIPISETLSKPSSLTHSIHGLNIHYAAMDRYAEVASTPLSFLPYSPEPDASTSKPKRRRERKHESSAEPNRIPNSSETTSVTSSRRKSRTFKQLYAMTDSFSSFSLMDDGCLGGF